MRKIETIITAGALFTVTTGDYSDYSVRGVFRALQDIEAESLRADYLQRYPNEETNYEFNEHKFMAYLLTLKLVEELHHFEFHLSNYSSIDDMDVTDNHFYTKDAGLFGEESNV